MNTYTRAPWTPAMVARREGDGTVVVRWAVSDAFVASGQDREEATGALRAFGTSPDSVDWSALEEVSADNLAAYSFYVGSAPFYDAHTSTGAVDAIPRDLRHDAHAGRTDVWGVWEGETEETAIYELRLADDATAQRIAYAMALRSGNDCVMVTRDARPGESDRAMSSVRPYLVSCEYGVTDGNRVLYSINGSPSERGYRFVPDVKGSEVAYLVWADASVSAVES